MRSVKKVTNIILAVVMILAIAAGAIACGGNNNEDPIDLNKDNVTKNPNVTANPDTAKKQPNSTPKPDNSKDNSGMVLGHTPDTVLIKAMVGEEEIVFTAADLSELEKSTIVAEGGDASSRSAGYVGVSLETLLKKLAVESYEALSFKNAAGETVEIKLEGMDANASVLAVVCGSKAIADEGDLVTFFAVDGGGKVIDSKPISIIEITLESTEG